MQAYRPPGNDQSPAPAIDRQRRPRLAKPERDTRPRLPTLQPPATLPPVAGELRRYLHTTMTFPHWKTVCATPLHSVELHSHQRSCDVFAGTRQARWLPTHRILGPYPRKMPWRLLSDRHPTPRQGCCQTRVDSQVWRQSGFSCACGFDATYVQVRRRCLVLLSFVADLTLTIIILVAYFEHSLSSQPVLTGSRFRQIANLSLLSCAAIMNRNWHTLQRRNRIQPVNEI